jgi:hypothetical protein
MENSQGYSCFTIIIIHHKPSIVMEAESSIAFSTMCEHKTFYLIERLATILYPSWRVLSDHRNAVDHPTGGSVVSNLHIHQGSFSLLAP